VSAEEKPCRDCNKAQRAVFASQKSPYCQKCLNARRQRWREKTGKH
jgi:hypothetical protein